MGRIHRANTKTAVKQRIIFCKGTIEEDICENVKDKITNIASLNDGDTLSYQIEGLSQNQTGIDMKKELSEFELLFQKINVLNQRKERMVFDIEMMKMELDKTNKEINELNDVVANLF